MFPLVRPGGATARFSCVQLVPSKVQVSFKYPAEDTPPNSTIFWVMGSYAIIGERRAEGAFAGARFFQLAATALVVKITITKAASARSLQREGVNMRGLSWLRFKNGKS